MNIKIDLGKVAEQLETIGYTANHEQQAMREVHERALKLLEALFSLEDDQTDPLTMWVRVRMLQVFHTAAMGIDLAGGNYAEQMHAIDKAVHEAAKNYTKPN